MLSLFHIYSNVAIPDLLVNYSLSLEQGVFDKDVNNIHWYNAGESAWF